LIGEVWKVIVASAHRTGVVTQLVVPLTLYAAFVASSLCIYALGSWGVRQSQALEEHAELLRANIQNLEVTNVDLNRQLRLLEGADTVRLLARELGYFREDEQVITVDSHAPRRSLYQVGSLVMRREDTRGVAKGQTAFFIPLILLLLVYAVRVRAV